MKVVATPKAVALVFETDDDMDNMRRELNAMWDSIQSRDMSWPLSFAVMDDSATEKDRQELVDKIAESGGAST